MPTLPMYDTAVTVPGGWRAVTAPGGWQRWRLDVIDETSSAIAIITLHDGRSEDLAYQRRYLRFTRSPTRRQPPVPAEYRAVEIACHLPDARHEHRLITVDAPDFEALKTELRVRVGDYSLQPMNPSQHRLVGPDVDLTLKPGGMDGSLWRVQGTVVGHAMQGAGVLHVDFDTSPRAKAIEYRIFLQDRVVVGSIHPALVTDVKSITVESHVLQTPRKLSHQRELYRVAGDASAHAGSQAGGVAIVDWIGDHGRK